MGKLEGDPNMTRGYYDICREDYNPVRLEQGIFFDQSWASLNKLMPVALELGGKSPHIVFADADIDAAVAAVADGIFEGSGQSCVAGSRLFVQKAVHDRMVAGLVERARSLRLDLPDAPGAQMGPLASFAHRDKVEGMVDAQPAEQVNLNGFARPVTAFSITRLKPKSAAQDPRRLWPLRIHALGQFTLLRDGQPIAFSRKVQKRPLDLLKAFRFTPDRLFPPYPEIMRSAVAGVMRQEVETVAPRTPLPRALEKMVRTRNKSLPVVEDDCVVGILTRDDVMRALRRAVAGEKPHGPV